MRKLVRQGGDLADGVGDRHEAPASVISECEGVAERVEDLRQEDFAGRAGRAVRLAEDQFRAIGRKHLVAGGTRPGQTGLVRLLIGESLGTRVEAGEGPRAATPGIIGHICRKALRVVYYVRNTIAGPLGAEVGVTEVCRLERIAAMVAHPKSNRGPHRWREGGLQGSLPPVLPLPGQGGGGVFFCRGGNKRRLLGGTKGDSRSASRKGSNSRPLGQALRRPERSGG